MNASMVSKLWKINLMWLKECLEKKKHNPTKSIWVLWTRLLFSKSTESTKQLDSVWKGKHTAQLLSSMSIKPLFVSGFGDCSVRLKLRSCVLRSVHSGGCIMDAFGIHCGFIILNALFTCKLKKKYT